MYWGGRIELHSTLQRKIFWTSARKQCGGRGGGLIKVGRRGIDWTWWERGRRRRQTPREGWRIRREKRRECQVTKAGDYAAYKYH